MLSGVLQSLTILRLLVIQVYFHTVEVHFDRIVQIVFVQQASPTLAYLITRAIHGVQERGTLGLDPVPILPLNL